MTKERPLLLQGAMVCATLNDSKTQTRRLQGLDQVNQSPDDWQLLGITIEPKKKDLVSTARFRHKDGEEISIACPYGKPKDLLWVRETWRPRSWGEDFDWMMIEYRAAQDLTGKGQPGMTKQIDPGDVWEGFHKEAAWENLAQECVKAGCVERAGNFVLDGENGKFPIKWRPSISMFRVMSRLSIEITDIRIERLQSISEGDAISEGCKFVDSDLGGCWTIDQRDEEFKAKFNGVGIGFQSARAVYCDLWDSINKKTHPWDSNPWCFVLDYKKLD